MSSSTQTTRTNQQIPAEFRALVARKNDVNPQPSLAVESLPFDALPSEQVTVRVRYSSLNYKDALAARGHPGVAKSLPHIPGVDAAGEVIAIDDQVHRAGGITRAGQKITIGSQVLVTGFELGAPRWGAFSELIRVPADWVVPLPQGLTLRSAMILGTAGLTAAQSMAALIHNGIKPDDGEIVVTGASGGVGSMAVGILVRLGYSVVAVSGKSKEELLARGVKRVITREEILDTSGKPLLKSTWAGAIDNVGGETLASIIRATQHRGCVTTCGTVGGTDLPLTVYPFVLRGVCLQGIDTAQTPMPLKLEMWEHLAGDWQPRDLESLVQAEATLGEMPHWIEQILAGKTKGRVILQM